MPLHRKNEGGREMTKAQLLTEVKSVVTALAEDSRLRCVLDEKKTRTGVRVEVVTALPAPKLPKRALSEKAGAVLREATELLQQMSSRRVLLDKKVPNTSKGLSELLHHLNTVMAQKDELTAQVYSFVNEAGEKLEELREKLRRLNSLASRRAKERAKEDRKAIEEGRYADVSYKRLKEFLHRMGFKDIVVLDASSKYRAIAFATVEYATNNWQVGSLWLAGIDDAGRRWRIELAPYAGYDLAEYNETTVERLMSIAFGVHQSIVKKETTMLQGDVLVFPCKEEEVQKHCGYLEDSPPAISSIYNSWPWDPDDVKLVTTWEGLEESYSEFSSLSINNSHVLQAPQGKVKRIRAKLMFNRNRVVVEQVIYHVILPEGGTLTHKEHAPLALAPGEYAIVSQINAFDAD